MKKLGRTSDYVSRIKRLVKYPKTKVVKTYPLTLVCQSINRQISFINSSL